MTKHLSLHKVLATLLIIAALFAGQQAFATSTFTVSVTGNSAWFTINRTGNTSIAETVSYRTVSLSALAGKHFTEMIGQVTFAANETSKTILVDETAIADVEVNYRYHDGTSRKYRFEVLDKDGSVLASTDRTIPYGNNYQNYKIVAADFEEKTVTVNSGETTAGDGGYRNNPYCTMSGSSYYNTAAPAEYLSAINAELRMTLTFQAKEVNDGYQYIQVLFDQDGNNDCDERPTSNISDGNPGTPDRSLYMAGFEHQPGSKNTNYASYSFPVLSVGNNAGANAPWNISPWNNSVGKLSIQKFKSNSDRASDGRLIAPTSFTTLDIRFNASGDSNDDWKSNNIEAHIQAVTTPTVLDNYKVSGGRHQKGNTIYVSVAFSEIVNITGNTKKLTTSWGDLTYLAGNGTNVLTFKGEISSSASGSFNVTGYNGTIKDLANNSFSGSISHNFGTSLDSDYVWSTSDFNSLGSNIYEIASSTDLLHLAYLVNKSSTQMNCSGLTFKQTYDITYTHGTSTNETNFTQIGGYFSDTGDRDFCGTYDGQGHTISGIRLYRPQTDHNVNKNVALFGRITGATIKNVILTDASFTGYRIVGGIVGNANNGGTVQNCLVVGSTITCGNTYVGVIVGRDPGTLTANYYRDCTVTVGSTSATTNVGVGGNGGISSSQDMNGARSLHTLTIQNANVTASGETVTYQDIAYYISNTTVTLTYKNGNSQGYQVTYSLNGTALSGNTFTMPAADATIDATATVFPWTGDGSAETPYTITTLGQLDLLAERVNSGTGDEYAADGYNGKYFVLDADITYTHTTDWNDAASTENNYTAIGNNSNNNSNPFKGNFDGQNHFVSGIRIYKGGTDDTDGYQGLFGYVNGGMVKRVHLTDARITGRKRVGGIIGETYLSTVEDCTVADNVAIHAVVNNSIYHGGIMGVNQSGIVQRCISHATLSVAPNKTGCTGYGGIVGYRFNNGSVKDCLAIGVTVPNVNDRGTIVGQSEVNSTVKRNYYRNCTVAGIANATGVGCNGADIIADQGALALYTLTLPENVTTDRTASATLPGTGNKTYTTGADIDDTPYYCQEGTVTLSYSGTVPEGYQVNYTSTGGTINGNILTMPAANVTVTVALVPDWSGSGTENSPYLITTTAQLNALANEVNNGTSYNGYFFKLDADITYDGTENNYTPIGNNYNSSNRFQGTFDGDGHAVSGIHINFCGNNLGLFGYVTGGTITNVTLRNSNITGHEYIGGIVGHLDGGTVTDCRVESTVTIGAYDNFSQRQGGIVGAAYYATVNGCISAATMTDNDKSNCNYYGGIVGYPNNNTTISNNIALGVNISMYELNTSLGLGAIAGDRNDTFTHNYYHGCTVKDVTTNVGAPGGDITTNDGAVQVFSLSLGEGITATPAPTVTYNNINYYTAGTGITLNANAGYEITSATITYGENSSNIIPVSGVYSFTMPAADATVSATTNLTGVILVDADHPFYEDFESGTFAPQGWSTISSSSHQWTASSDKYKSPSHSAYSYIYGDGGMYLVMPALQLTSNASEASLSFWSYNNWSHDYQLGNNAVVLLDGDTETWLWWAQSVNQDWEETVIDLSAYLGQTITLAFKYSGQNGNGWYVDDVQVSASGSTVLVESIVVNPNETEMNVGTTYTILYTVLPADATNPAVTFTSSDESVATVDEDGDVTGVAAGTATITIAATDGSGVTGTFTVTVMNVDVEEIYVNNDDIEIMTGETAIITYTVLPAEATIHDVTFTSANTAIATVDADGVVTGVGMGETTITVASVSNPDVTATIEVTVNLDPNGTQFTKGITGYGNNDNPGGWYLIASPLADNVAPTAVTQMTSNTFDLYYFDQSREKEWVNYKEHEGNADPGFDLVSGKGYLYANSENVPITFGGTPYSGNGVIDLTYSEENSNQNMWGWNLVGNPFAANATISGTPFYRMNDVGSEIIAATNNTVKPMEGIFVKATQPNQTVTFQTAAKGNVISNSAALVMNISQNRGSVIDRAIVRFDEGRQLPKLQIFENSDKLYIPQSGEEYAIVSAGNMGEIPLNFKATKNGEYTITVNPEGVAFGYLHLIDNMTGADVDLLTPPVCDHPITEGDAPLLRGQGGFNKPATYTFTARTTDYESRFKLVFSVCGDANGDNEAPFAFINNGNIIVNGEGTLQVVDVMGHILVSGDAINRVSTGGMAAGVYVLRLINGDDVRTQRVVVR